jgi:hypothetical protein
MSDGINPYNIAKQITITLSSNEAEDILYALVLRSRQSKVSEMRQNEAVSLAHNLDKQFAKQLGWDTTIDRVTSRRKQMKRVSVTFYDYPPNN